jgi:hypothetical protein
MKTAPQPQLEYFASASQTSLEAFELARLNHIARLRTEILQTLEQLVAAEVEARLAQRLTTHPALHNVLLLAPPGPSTPPHSNCLALPRARHLKLLARHRAPSTDPQLAPHRPELKAFASALSTHPNIVAVDCAPHLKVPNVDHARRVRRLAF